MILHLLAADTYRPFLDPLPVWPDSRWPLLLLPLCAGVAIVYKSIRCNSMAKVPREAAAIATWIVLGMAGAGAVLWVVVRKIFQ